MRTFSRCLIFLAALLPSLRLAAQSTTPSLFAPPAQAAGPADVVPSEPWHPAGSSAMSPTSAGPQAAELPEPALSEAAGEASTSLLDSEPPAWYSPIGWLGPTPWDSGIELGVNGSSGTGDSFSMHTGAYIKRESRFSRIDLNTYYNLTMNSGKSVQDNALFDACQDWLIDESSPWTLFFATDLFYDKFQSFDLETNFNTGIGYRFVHSPELELMARVGGGTMRQFGGPEDRWKPESLVGLEYTQRITQTQKFYAKLDYYPEWDEVGQYRVMADMGWEVELVQPSNLSLKISATDRYDNAPDGVSPHLVNYSVLLLLKL